MLIIVIFDLYIEQGCFLELLEQPSALLRLGTFNVSEHRANSKKTWLKTAKELGSSMTLKLVTGDKPVAACRGTSFLGLIGKQ